MHRIAMHPARPDVLFMQKHWDIMRSDDAGESWQEVSGNLPTHFGFVIDVHAHESETVYVVPIKSDMEHYPPDGKLRVYRIRLHFALDTDASDEQLDTLIRLTERYCVV